MSKDINTISVSIADDHTLFAEGLANMLGTMPDILIKSVSSNGVELLNSCEADGLADVVLLDIGMPVMDGFQTITELIRRYPEAKVIVISMFRDFGYISRMILAGASGYLLKNARPNELAEAVRSVADGGLAFNQEAVSVMKSMVSTDGKNNFGIVEFSERELEIIDMICKEKSSTDIAGHLHITRSAVEAHKRNIFQKINVNSAVGIAVYAVKNRIVGV